MMSGHSPADDWEISSASSVNDTVSAQTAGAGATEVAPLLSCDLEAAAGRVLHPNGRTVMDKIPFLLIAGWARGRAPKVDGTIWTHLFVGESVLLT